MTKHYRHFVFVLALALPGWLSLWAGEYDESAPAPLQKGRILILQNDRLLEGDIERVGDQYRVRRSIGETWLPGDKVLALCADIDDALAFLRRQANMRDPDERLRLARWCQLHGLRKQALEEATAASAIRPDNEESKRLMRNLQRSLATGEDSAEKPKEEAEPETAAGPPVPYNSASLGMFVSRVQPILMNTCATCHATGKGGSFKLSRAFDDGGLVSRKATQQNLTAVLAQLHQQRPQESPLLTRAITVHGDTDHPPLKGRAAPAFHILEEWAQLATTDIPKEAPAAAATDAKANAAPTTATTVGASWFSQLPASAMTTPKEKEPEAKQPAPEKTTPFAEKVPAPEKPAGAPEAPADPFDPMIFNQQK